LQIRTYKESLANVTGDLKRAKDKFARSSLMAGAGGPSGSGGYASPGSAGLDFGKSA